MCRWVMLWIGDTDHGRPCLVLLPAFMLVAVKSKNTQSFYFTNISKSAQWSCAKLLDFYTPELLKTVAHTWLQEGTEERQFPARHTSRPNRACGSCSPVGYAVKELVQMLSAIESGIQPFSFFPTTPTHKPSSLCLGEGSEVALYLFNLAPWG